MSYMVVTEPGAVRQADNKGDGFEEQDAMSDARERNVRAEALGIQTRYVVVPFTRVER